MKITIALLLICIIIIFGLSSISQSYASAKQAQAVIETARVAQIASAGNLVIIVTMAVLLLAAVGVIAYLLLRTKSQSKVQQQWVPGPNAHWGQIPQPNPNAMLPALMSLLLYQMMQHQNQEQEQLWQMGEAANNEPVNYLDNTWEL